MVPLVGAVMDRLGAEVSVGPWLVPHIGLFAAKVVVGYAEVFIAEYEGEGVELRQVQGPSWPHQRGDDPGPAADVRQPVDGPEPGVDNVEVAPAQSIGRVVDVGRRDLGLDADLGGQSP